MSFLRLFFPLLLTISGCVHSPHGPGFASAWPFSNAVGYGDRAAASFNGLNPSGATRSSGYRRFSFDWQVSGDSEVLPLQVFDDGVQTWLQFARDSAWPAVFESTPQGWRPLAHRQEADYMVIDGVYSEMALRGGHLHGTVRRVSMPTSLPADPAQNTTTAMRQVAPVTPMARSAPTAGSAMTGSASQATPEPAGLPS